MHFQKTYLSREMTRALALDHPIGDPFGGPAYGEKNGPAAAVVGAFLSIEAGLAIGASTFLGGMMIAGGVMSGLGAITGNATLSKLGMIAGIVGGVGSMMNPEAMSAMQGAFSDNTGLLQGAGDTTSAVSGSMTQVVDGVPSSTIAPPVDAAASGLPAPVADVGGAAQTAATSSGGSIPNYFNADAGVSTDFFGASNGGSIPKDFIADGAGGGGLTTQGMTDAAYNTAAGASAQPSGGGMLSSVKEAWNGLGDMSKGQVIKGGLDFVGGVAKGVMDYPAMQKQLEIAQQKLDNDTTMTEMNRQLAQQKIDQEKRRIENMKSQGAAVPTVNANYQSNMVRQPNGMINLRPA